MASTSTKTSAARRSAHPASIAPVLQVRMSTQEITPLTARRFARSYEIEDNTLGVRVIAEEGAHFCGTVDNGCAWCEEHGQRNHADFDPNRTLLGISVSPIGGEGSGEFFQNVSAAQLDALIDLLFQVRERARADGALGPAGGCQRSATCCSTLESSI